MERIFPDWNKLSAKDFRQRNSPPPHAASCIREALFFLNMRFIECKFGGGKDKDWRGIMQ